METLLHDFSSCVNNLLARLVLPHASSFVIVITIDRNFAPEFLYEASRMPWRLARE